MCQCSNKNTIQDVRKKSCNEDGIVENIIPPDLTEFLCTFLGQKGVSSVIESQLKTHQTTSDNIVRSSRGDGSATQTNNYSRDEQGNLDSHISRTKQAKKNLKSSQISPEQSCCCRHNYNLLLTELLYTKLEIRNYKLMHMNIQLLYMLNIIVLLFYIIIIILIIIYVP